MLHGHQIVPSGDTEQLSALARAMDADILITGHTHRFEAFEFEGRFFVNPGSATGAWHSVWPFAKEEPAQAKEEDKAEDKAEKKVEEKAAVKAEGQDEKKADQKEGKDSAKEEADRAKRADGKEAEPEAKPKEAKAQSDEKPKALEPAAGPTPSFACE